MTVNRSEVSRALAKAIAYKECGKDAQAAAWAAQLVVLLGNADILDTTTQAWAVVASRSLS